MEANSEAEVIARLQREGSIPIRPNPPAPAAPRSVPADAGVGRGQALSRQELSDVTRELSLMLGAGQDLDRALRFRSSGWHRGRACASRYRACAMRCATALAPTALPQQPAAIQRLYVGLVRAGEAGGKLNAALAELAELLNNHNATLRRPSPRR